MSLVTIIRPGLRTVAVVTAVGVGLMLFVLFLAVNGPASGGPLAVEEESMWCMPVEASGEPALWATIALVNRTSEDIHIKQLVVTDPPRNVTVSEVLVAPIENTTLAGLSQTWDRPEGSVEASGAAIAAGDARQVAVAVALDDGDGAVMDGVEVTYSSGSRTWRDKLPVGLRFTTAETC